MTVPDLLAAVFAEDELLAPDPDEVLAAIRAEIGGTQVRPGRRLAPLLAGAAAVAIVAGAVTVATDRTGSDPRPGSGSGADTSVADRPAFRYREPTPAGELIPAAQRQRAESLSLPGLSGGSFTLADHRHDVVVLMWSASWCGPCRAAASGAGDPTRMTGVDVRTIATKDDRATARTVFDPSATLVDVSGHSLKHFGTLPSVLPLTVLVDREQLVAAVYSQPITAALLRSAVQRLAAEPGS